MNSFPIEAPAFNGASRAVPAENAFAWLRHGWTMFAARPGQWLAVALVLLVLVLGIHVVPVVGNLAATLLAPTLAAGMLFACKRAADDEPVEVADLFAGFRRNTGNLVLIGLAYLAASLAVFGVGVALGGGSLAGGLLLGSPLGLGLALGGVFFALLLTMVLWLPVLMALFFAPALAFFNGMQPIDALKASFAACLKNLLAFIVFGVVVVVLAFFAALPVGLGFLVLVPVLAGSAYAAYRDVFLAD